MNYPAVNINDAAQELNRLHGEIEQKLRTTVQDAIRAGEILTQVKDRLDHGEFLPWIERNCEFRRTQADVYMRLYRHGDKLPTAGNLREAEQIVAQIESREKQSEGQKARERVKHYLKTGEKPEGWRRGTDDKLAQEELDRDERIEKAKAKMEAARIEREAEQAARKAEWEAGRIETETLMRAADLMAERAEKKREFKERIRLSQSGESDLFIDALMEYLDELDDDNRRIEACQNIIKVCRNIANELQREVS